MTSYKVLVVDDIIDNLKTIISIIEKYHPNYMIYQANNGRKALEIAENSNPNIIITDWDMPGISGIELVRALQSDPELKYIPVIITTGVMITSEDLKTALSEGAVDYLRKPVNSIELLSRMQSAITISEHQQQIIKEKESKIVENALLTNQMNIFLQSIAHSLKDIRESEKENAHVSKELSGIIARIIEKIQTRGWQQFAIAFNKLHPDFEKKIMKNHPDLTAAELKLATLIRLGFNIKEISEMIFVTPESMRVLRSRLRKKMELGSQQNLDAYISSF